ncbi:hypothetical protein K523DRAFT_141398 [Schizophyllum commune Tattone D]|nr:hypothetical protein K523DRAFT_141398 [Schizophyllum commune Tattone D]
MSTMRYLFRLFLSSYCHSSGDANSAENVMRPPQRTTRSLQRIGRSSHRKPSRLTISTDIATPVRGTYRIGIIIPLLLVPLYRASTLRTKCVSSTLSPPSSLARQGISSSWTIIRVAH